MTLEQLRTNKGFTTEEMAKEMNISTKDYETKEMNPKRIKAEELFKIFNILNLSKEEINSFSI